MGLAVFISVGQTVGLTVAVGHSVGFIVGLAVGLSVGHIGVAVLLHSSTISYEFAYTAGIIIPITNVTAIKANINFFKNSPSF